MDFFWWESGNFPFYSIFNYVILGNMMYSLAGTATLTGYKCDHECNEALTNCNMYYVMYKKAKEAVKLTVSLKNVAF